MKNIKFSMLAVLTISPLALGEVYYLQKNETVSELLYNRLKIDPIYRNGYLQKVLQHNNLTDDSSRKLPEGAAIDVPDSLVGAEVAASPEPTPETETSPEPVVEPEADPNDRVYSPAPGQAKFYAGLNLGVESMEGDVEPASFSSVFFFPQAKLGFFHESESLIHQLEAGASYVTFKKDKYMEGNNQLVNGHVFYQLMKKQSQLRWGLKVSGDNSVMIVSTPDASGYKLKNPFIISFGPSIQWQGEKILSELNLLYAPAHKVDSNNDLNSGLNLQAAGWMPVSEKLHFGLTGSYQKLDVEKTDINKTAVSAAARWFF